MIRDDVALIEPLDELERVSKADVLAWIDSGVDLCRLQKPDVPPQHLVSYGAVVDGDHVLLVDHVNAELWLPTGGHVEPGEHPRAAALREAKEELAIECDFLRDGPLFLTVTQTVGKTAGHTDVSLWYALRGDRSAPIQIDPREFRQARWFRCSMDLSRDPETNDWLAALCEQHRLSAAVEDALMQRGFVVVPGPVPVETMPALQAAYDAAVDGAADADVRHGSTSTRVNDFVNRGPAFDAVYAWPTALDACCRVIQRPFRLSVMNARTLRVGACAQELHADIPRTSDAWPMLGLILMVDAFHAGNGATRFVPGSHRWTQSPADVLGDPHAAYPDEVLACGPAGSVILFNASTLHSHTANTSSAPRRSLQATFIPRNATPATDFAGRMRPETLARIDSAARYFVGIDSAVESGPA